MRFTILNAALIWFASTSASAAPAFSKVPDLKCPEELSLAPDQSLTQTPEGWRKFVDTANYRALLLSADFYSGSPEGRAMLIPQDDGTVSFAPNDGWIACVYERTPVQITRKIPAPYSSCKVVFTSKKAKAKDARRGPIDAVECR